jgi:uncharacterized protein YndB with AHSA1/START domain
MATQNKSTVALPNDRDVVVTRAFNAPRSLVYDAYTKPELVSRWLLGPPGWTMPVCEMDVRVGGKFRWRWRNETGTEFGFSGVFKEVLSSCTRRPTTGHVGGDMGEALITALWTEKAGVTTHTMTIRYASKEVRDAALKTGMTDGMEMSFQKLDELLADTG